jgi:hypothetical protein
MIHIEHFTFNAFQTRCCVVWDDNGHCAFVDPGCSTPQEILEVVSLVNSRQLTPVCIMLTHAHFDHIYGMSALAKEYEIPVYANMGEMFTLETTNPAVCEAYGLPLPDTFPMIKSFSDAHIGSRFYHVSRFDTIDVCDLWDDLCNELPFYFTREDIVEEFAKKYDVDINEVREYFEGMD